MPKTLTLIALTFLYSASAHAQLFSSNKKNNEKFDAIQEQIDALKNEQQKNAPILQQLSVVQEKFRQLKADSSVMIEDLRNENQILKGEIAFLKRQMEIFENNQKSFFKDAEFRLSEMESNASKKSSAKKSPRKKTNTVVPSNQSKEDSAKKTYDQALNLMQKQKNHSQAIGAFENFISNHPKHNLVPNAHYWIGESYHALGKHARAIKTFDIISKKYPRSSKKCDAILMQAKGFEALKKDNEAKLFYSEVVSTCPKSSAAKKAQQKIKG